MKRLIYIAAGFVLFLLGAFVALALYIPAEKEFTQVIEIDAPAEVVWQVMTDREKYPEWQDQIEKVQILNDKEWIEHTAGGELRFRIDARDEGRSMEISYSMGDTFRGSWRGELSPRGEDRSLIRTTDRTVVEGWATRVMMWFFFDIEEFAKDWNNKLKKRSESLR